MLEQLFYFFQQLFLISTLEDSQGNVLMSEICFHINGDINDLIINLGDYFALICSLISLIIIFILCCLFVYKIVRLIGGLIR